MACWSNPLGQMDTLNQPSDETGYRIKGKYRDRNMAMYINAKEALWMSVTVWHSGMVSELQLSSNYRIIHSLGAELSL